MYRITNEIHDTTATSHCHCLHRTIRRAFFVVKTVVSILLIVYSVGCDCGAYYSSGSCVEGFSRCDSGIVLSCRQGEWSVLENCKAEGKVCTSDGSGAICITAGEEVLDAGPDEEASDFEESGWLESEQADDMEYVDAGELTEPFESEFVEIDDDVDLPVKEANISVGRDHVCSVDVSGRLWCWGGNRHGQLGDGTTETRAVPTFVGDGWKYVAAGCAHTCAIKTDGSLWCWGDNTFGAVGDGTDEERHEPVEVAGDYKWMDVFAGCKRTCALDDQGTIFCWGFLGSKKHFVPLGYSEAGKWVEISGYEYEFCGIRPDTSLYCGFVGNPGHYYELEPKGKWKKISKRDELLMAIREDTSLWFGGFETLKQVGTGWVDASCGPLHRCAVKSDGSLWCQGENSYGELGNGTLEPSKDYVRVSEDRKWADVEVGEEVTCAIDQGGQVWCWGSNFTGQLGQGTTGNKDMPRHSNDALPDVSTVSAGLEHTCAIKTDGSLWCWGDNRYGQVGHVGAQKYQQPMEVERRDGKWTQVTAGLDHTCAITEEGSLFCWGHNASGQVGNGTLEDVALPSEVAGSGTWKSVVAVNSRIQDIEEPLTCGIKADGTLWCWGSAKNRLGGTEPGNEPTPVKVGGHSDWTLVSVGAAHACGIRSDTSLWCWGGNSYGQLGNGTLDDQYEPVRITNESGWQDVAAGGAHTCGIKSDGSLWCWGDNDYGQLGVQRIEISLKPVQVMKDRPWRHVMTGELNTCALTPENKLWCWGWNKYGQLGFESLEETTSAVLVSELSWKQVSMGETHTCGTDYEGKLYCWGGDSYGKLGYGDAWRKVPVPVF